MKFEKLVNKSINEVEKQYSEQWDKNKIFEKSVDTKSKKNNYVFYDGPATANGMPGIHHMMAKLLKDTVCKYKTMKGYAIAPKYDGISVALKIENHRLIYAATRYDGVKGQNITALVKQAQFPSWFKDAPDGYYKCEILMSIDDYNELVKEKQYANRRSAVSGIVNTPSNIEYGKYLTIMPLVYYNQEKQDRR